MVAGRNKSTRQNRSASTVSLGGTNLDSDQELDQINRELRQAKPAGRFALAWRRDCLASHLMGSNGLADVENGGSAAIAVKTRRRGRGNAKRGGRREMVRFEAG